MKRREKEVFIGLHAEKVDPAGIEPAVSPMPREYVTNTLRARWLAEWMVFSRENVLNHSLPKKKSYGGIRKLLTLSLSFPEPVRCADNQDEHDDGRRNHSGRERG